VYVLVYYFHVMEPLADVFWFLYSRVELHSRYPASAGFERAWGAINSVVGTFWGSTAAVGLGCLARSLAALVLDVIFGNYTFTYIYIYLFLLFFLSSSLSSFLVLFLITPLLIPLIFDPFLWRFHHYAHHPLVHMSRTSAPSQYCVPPPPTPRAAAVVDAE